MEFSLGCLPRRLRVLAIRHHEFVKFGMVGAATFVLDTTLFYMLKLTLLAAHPVMAKVLAVTGATLASYLLNREWSFRTRGGRRTTSEATLYFGVSAAAVMIYAAPLWISRHLLHLHTPYTTRLIEELADFTSGQILGVLLGMLFRWWAFRRWVFPSTTSAQHTDTSSPAELTR